jgi:hypothetical protein
MKSTTCILTVLLFALLATCTLAHWAQLEPEMMIHNEANRQPGDDWSTQYPYRIPVDDYMTERSITGYVGGKDKYDEIAFSVSPAHANTSTAELSLFPLVWACPAYTGRYIDLVVIGPCDGKKFVKKTFQEIKKYPFDRNTVDVNTQCFYELIQPTGNTRGILNEGFTNNTFLYPNDLNSVCLRTRPAPTCTGMNNVIYRYKISQPGNYRIVYWEKHNRQVDYSVALGVRGSGRSSLKTHEIYTYIVGKAYAPLTFNNKRARVACPYTQVSTDWNTYLDDANNPDLSQC